MLSLASIVATAACGGDDDRPPTTPPPTTPPPTSPPPSGGVVTVTGTERIGWTQTVQASQSIQQFRFAAYIDNRSRANLASVQCATSGTANVFNCSAALPQMSQGRHSLQLSAFDTAGAESAPSTELVLNVVGRVVVSSAPVPGIPARTCVDASGEAACYAVDVLVQGLAQPSNLLTTTDGRLLFVERQTEVFLFERGQLLRSTLVPPDSGATIQSIALAADFDSSRFVFAAIAAARDDQRTLSIVRFREAGGTLAEAAVIVPDLPIAKGGEVALSVGDGNDLYVALPAADTTNPSSAGVILRFDSQGAAKGQSRLASPVLAESSPRPAKLAWGDGRLWLAGLETATSPALGQLSMERDATPDPGPRHAEPVQVKGFPSAGWGVRDLAPSEGAARSEQSGLFFVLENPRALYRLVNNENGVLTPALVPLASLLPEAVSTAPNDVVYVAAMLASDPSQGVILRLMPVAARRALPR
jgi:hypothetical protein